MESLTILTPSYNRAHTLINCYNSLKNQSDKDFEWIIIDDGSNDETRDLINKLQKESLFRIRYIYKDNGGKHTALNYGISLIDNELTIILDSDDVLTNDAISTIKLYWNQYRGNKEIAGMSFLRGYDYNTQIGDKFPQNFMKSNNIQCRYNMGISGDKSEVFRTSVLKEFPFPEVKGEKFIGECVVWNRMARKYDMIYINKIIYITEYLDGGLTKSGRALRIRNPEGGMLSAKECTYKDCNINIRIKYRLLYICYGFFAKKSVKFMLKDSENTILTVLELPFAYLLYKYWKLKYK